MLLLLVLTQVLAAWASFIPQEDVLSSQALAARDDSVPNKYRSVDGFFKQDDEDTDNASFDVVTEQFGLKKGVSWKDVISEIKQLNQESSKHKYKLFFLARHGQGYHNIAPAQYSEEAWTCYWQEKDGNGKIEWYDALLTPDGEDQVKRIEGLWQSQLQSNNAPLPQSFYVSPLRRTIQTFYATWKNILDPSKNPSQYPLAKENARETYGIGTESKRHDQTYIHQNWPDVKFESGFSNEDIYWTADKHEPSQHKKYRATLLLNDIFVNDPNEVISITAHSGIIKTILKLIDHRKWPMRTAEVIPVVIKASKWGKYVKPELNDPWETLPSSCSNFNPSEAGANSSASN